MPVVLLPHMSSPEFAARLGTLTNTSSAWRQRWHDWALGAVLVHRCTWCGWELAGRLEETRAAFLEHAAECPVAPRNGHHRGASSTPR